MRVQRDIGRCTRILISAAYRIAGKNEPIEISVSGNRNPRGKRSVLPLQRAKRREGSFGFEGV
jgi:hypothetical protein